MIPLLPDGLYPFIDQRLPLAEMTMVEASPHWRAVLPASHFLEVDYEARRLKGGETVFVFVESNMN